MLSTLSNLGLASLLLLLTPAAAFPAAPAAVETEVEPGVFIYTYPQSSENPNDAVKRELVARDAYCNTDAFFANKSSPGSPLVSDCEKVRDYAYDNPHFWCVDHCYGNCKHKLIKVGTCVFGGSGGLTNCVPFGNEDAGDLVRDSIDKFKWNDDGTWKIGAEGSVVCRQPGGLGSMAWAVYHS